VALSHGDRYATGVGYDLYCKLLRNKTTLKLLQPFEKSIIDERMQKLSQKNICHPFVGFESRVEKILTHYKKADLVIEGHFHQAKQIGKYISLPSLACQAQVGVVKEGCVLFQTL
jgi:UDP-2,3-diacylglucosamine hydrolase